MKKVIQSICFSLFFFIGSAQTTFEAQDILEQIANGETVAIENATIIGNLDFTKVKKKFKGGRYGVRGGIAQEYFTLVTAPISFTSCKFLGAIITKAEVKVGRERQEYFTTLRADVTFLECAFNQAVNFESMRIKENITFVKCTFQNEFKFQHVTFSKSPQLKDNIFNARFLNKNTNWNADRTIIEKQVSTKRNSNVHLTLHNPTMNSIKIVFGSNKWKLSPFGKSGISSPIGTKIYILEKGSKRLALTMNQTQEGNIIDISTL